MFAVWAFAHREIIKMKHMIWGCSIAPHAPISDNSADDRGTFIEQMKETDCWIRPLLVYHKCLAFNLLPWSKRVCYTKTCKTTYFQNNNKNVAWVLAFCMSSRFHKWILAWVTRHCKQFIFIYLFMYVCIYLNILFIHSFVHFQ